MYMYNNECTHSAESSQHAWWFGNKNEYNKKIIADITYNYYNCYTEIMLYIHVHMYMYVCVLQLTLLSPTETT